MIERIKTGIEGLDELLEGGFVKGSCILIVGAPGAGKTIFGMQFLIEGLKNNENGIYFSLEERKEDLLSDVERFGWKDFLEKKESERKFLIVNLLPTSVEKIREEIIRYCNMIDAKRIVLDNVTLMKMSWEEVKDQIGKKRRIIFDLVSFFKSKKITSLLLSEWKGEKLQTEEFLADGVIKLYYLAQGLPRALQIVKMRKTKHTLELIPFEISDKGIVLKKMF